MRAGVLGALVVAGGLGGCAVTPPPPDPIRVVNSPADVSACRRIGSVGEPVRTDGTGPGLFDTLVGTQPVRRVPAAAAPGTVPGENAAERLGAMKAAAVSRGATDLLLTRRFYRDWSFVEGVAYSCRV